MMNRLEKPELDTGKYCQDITFCLQQCGKKSMRVSTFAEKLINLKIWNRMVMIKTTTTVICDPLSKNLHSL